MMAMLPRTETATPTAREKRPGGGGVGGEAWEDMTGLVTIEKRNGFPGPGPFDFDPHPTNAGHSFIAKQFANTWKALAE